MAGLVTIYEGDVRARLGEMPAASVDCVVTSPPYWGLRDYGGDGQIGMEPTLGAHLDTLVEVFAAVRRVMKPTATLWLNHGDCYATTPNGRSAADTKAAGTDDRTFRDKPFSTVGAIYESEADQKRRDRKRRGAPPKGRVVGGVAGAVLKPKDLCMMANRLAIALQEDGWWVRSEIVWGKPNAMPDSSGRYRPATAHEKIFLLTKTAHHDYDAEAVRMTARSAARTYRVPAGWDTGDGPHGKFHKDGRRQDGEREKQRGHSRRHAGFNARWDAMSRAEQMENGRLLRNWEEDLTGLVDPAVWRIPAVGYEGAHFATFPPLLAAICIKAGSREGGLVLDPFGGAGTVGLVAARLKRRAALIELNPDYCALARARIAADAPLFAEVEGKDVS